MTYLPSDKIGIFVSSRLEECAEERKIVRMALESLNHDPIMFESAGARPYPPRSVYLKGVESSVFFVGVYKEGYGFVADGMDISGLEDEYSYSKALGIPQLLYVKKDCRRDPRLEALVSQFMGPSITVGSYGTPDELYEKVRDDITALVADYVFRGRRAQNIALPSAKAVVERIVPSERRVYRTTMEGNLRSLLEKTSIVTVVGLMGAGKTVFLLGLASREEWLFVECGEQTPREILISIAGLIREKIGLEPIVLAQMEQTTEAFKASWQAIAPTTLVLDDVRSEDVVRTVLDATEPMGDRRIVMSGRDGTILPRHSVFVVPPFDEAEVRDFVAKNRGTPMNAGELENLMMVSKGNPLYLRYYASGYAGSFEHTIKDYETKAWRDLTPRAREAVNYLSLSPRPLHLRI